VTLCGLWYLLDYVSRIVNTLMLVAAMLWSGVCFAECRILPEASHAEAKSSVPPCHKQKQQTSKPCVDPGACVLETATGDQQEQQVVVHLSAISIAAAVTLGHALPPLGLAVIRTPQHFAGSERPRTSVLRI